MCNVSCQYITNHILQKIITAFTSLGQVFTAGPVDEQDEKEEIITMAG